MKKPGGPVLGATSPGKLLKTAHLRLRGGMARALAGAGHALTGDQFIVLAMLGESDMTQLEIAESLGKDRPYTSRLVDELEDQGLVERRVSSADRRLKHVSLTRAGRTTKTSARRTVFHYFESVFSGVSQTDYDAFTRCLNHVIERAGQ